jgi:phosphoribosyl 1,2-cyclic phosphodiesterase
MFTVLFHWGLAKTMDITFHGVRGSTPCHGQETARYGGNTSCVSVVIPEHDPLLFDLGTGLRYFGLNQPVGSEFRGHCLLSHLHWDHIQGLPFFTPILREGAHLTVYGPAQEDGRTLEQVMMETVRPPLFPISLDKFPGTISFVDVEDSDLMIGEIQVKSRLIPHVGLTCGYRVSHNGKSVAYLSDHQMPYDGSFSASDAALELIDGCDLVIHDAQYTAPEFAQKATWGHCTVDYAVWLAAEAGAKQLALFHHDPTRCDDAVDHLVMVAAAAGRRCGVDVIAASEGLTISL